MNSVVVAPAWLGDAVMAQVLVARIAARWPGEGILWFAPPSTAPLGERLPGIDDTLVLPVGHGEIALGRRWQAGRALRARGLRRAFVLPGSFKAALAPRFAGVPERIGYRKEGRSILLTDARPLDTVALPRMVDRFVALADVPGSEVPPQAPRLRADQARAAGLREALGLVGERPVLALCPGAAYGSAKRWPAGHYAALAKRALARGEAVWLFGGPQEREVTARIRADCDAAASLHDLAGRTSLLDAIDLLSLADRVVSNDSGLMHAAAALGRPLLALYGSTTPAFTPPLDEGARVLERALDCRPCFARTCPLGHRDCLRGISVDEVDARLPALAERCA